MDISAIRHSNSELDEPTAGQIVSEDEQVYFEFDVDRYTFLVRHEVHCEYIRLPQIFSLPLMPDWLQGQINVRGLLVPVINLHCLLGDEKLRSNKECQHALVLDKNENAAALLIERPPRVTRFPEYKRSEISAPVNMPAGICESMFKSDGREFYVVNHNFLFESLSKSELNREPGNGWTHTGSAS